MPANHRVVIAAPRDRDCYIFNYDTEAEAQAVYEALTTMEFAFPGEVRRFMRPEQPWEQVEP